MPGPNTDPNDVGIRTCPFELSVAGFSVAPKPLLEREFCLGRSLATVAERVEARHLAGRIVGCGGDHRRRVEVEEDLHGNKHEEKKDRKCRRGADRSDAIVSR